MRKKIICFVTSVVLASTLVGCGSASSTDSHSTTAVSSASASTSSSVSASSSSTKKDVSKFNQVLVDDDNCKMEITGIDEKGLWGYTWKVYLENKTSDEELMFSIDKASINGVMCDPYWADSVTAGSKANKEISWPSKTLEDNNIKEVTQVEFNLRVYDNNDFSKDALVDQTFTVYPLGEDAATTVQHTDSATDQVLFDNDQCKMTVTGYDPDNMWGYTVNVYLENKTDHSLYFTEDGASVNGYMCDPYWSTEVAAGKSSNSTISFSSTDFDTNGITDVTEIKLPIKVYNENDFGNYIVDQTFTLNPS